MFADILGKLSRPFKRRTKKNVNEPRVFVSFGGLPDHSMPTQKEEF